MNCYIDSSVILQILLGSNNSIIDFSQYAHKISSELLIIECNRVVDRYRLEGLLNDEQTSDVKQNLQKMTDGMFIVEISETVKLRARGSFPTVIGTLGSIHLSTAILWKEYEKTDELIIISHDKQMCLCARALGLIIFDKWKI